VRRNADAGDVDRGAASAEAEARDDDEAARRSEGARVWRRRHMAGVVVVVFSGRPSWRCLQGVRRDRHRYRESVLSARCNSKINTRGELGCAPCHLVEFGSLGNLRCPRSPSNSKPNWLARRSELAKGESR
jgi:hypothetical protein